MSCAALEDANPELAAFGPERLNGKVAYLARIRKEGWPRVQPVTAIIGEGHFFLFMEPTSPKGHDLRRNPRHAVQCGVADNSCGSAEFACSGTARLSTCAPADRSVLFECEVERAQQTTYQNGGPRRTSWIRGG